MKTKARLLTIVLAGILLGVVVVKVKQSARPLSARLVSTDDATRVSALKIFSVKSDDGRQKTVDEIVSLYLSTGNPRQLQFALYALRKSGVATPKVINPMIDALSSNDAKVREEASAGLLELGDAAVPLEIATLGSDVPSRNPAIALLAKGSPRVIPSLISALSDHTNILKQRGAAAALFVLPPGDTLKAAHEAIPALLTTLKSPDNILSLNSAFAIHLIDPANTAPTAVFLKHVQMADWDSWEVRGWSCAEILGTMKGSAAQSLPVLTRLMLSSPDGYNVGKRYRRTFLAGVIEQLAPRSSKVSDLTWDLKNRDTSIRYRAVLKIGSNPKGYVSMIGPLTQVIDDRDPAVGARAVWAFTQIGLQFTKPIGATLYPKYVAFLGRTDEKTFEGFHGYVGPFLGGMNENSLPSVIDAVKTGALRLETANIILRGTNNAGYLKALMAHNKNGEVRLMAAIALARLDPKTEGLADELAKGSKRLGKVGEDVKKALKVVQDSTRKK